MAIQLAVSTRNARLDAIETEIGTAAVLKLRTGAQPADCATADAGTVIASFTLPSDYMAAAASGSKAKTGSWPTPAAAASGTIAHFRVYDSGGSVCHMQGSCGLGTGDMQLDNNVVTSGQVITVTAFTLTDANS